MGKKKKDNNVVISFLSGSATDVTGSCVTCAWESPNGHKLIAFDMGFIQGSMSPEEEYSVNQKVVENINPLREDLLAVFLSHSHLPRPCTTFTSIRQ